MFIRKKLLKFPDLYKWGWGGSDCFAKKWVRFRYGNEPGVSELETTRSNCCEDRGKRNGGDDSKCRNVGRGDRRDCIRKSRAIVDEVAGKLHVRRFRLEVRG